ncbi:MAG: tetratricopeptide repeat protein [Nitrospinae bacterium]|nr:tetratricopeptide repeat protein [Nitrospinota bacterium]MBF0634789.1 tetratricopeptide repeat protein [Nitrospinota bacterium]
MTIKSAFTLRAVSRLAKAGRMETAVESLKKACGDGIDPRLFIQKALLSGEKEDRAILKRLYPKNAAAMVTASVLSYGAGEYEDAVEFAMDGLSARPSDPSLKTLILLSRSRSDQGLLNIHDLRVCAKNAILTARAYALAEVERRMIQLRPGDRGVVEKEETLGGPFGFILDRLDDLAAVIGYLLSHSLNLVTHAMDGKKRAVYRLIAEGDRLWAMRRRGEAAGRFEEALRIDPECVEALESLTRHYLDEGETAKAVACFTALEKSLDTSGGSTPLHLTKISADLAFFTGKYNKACDLYAETIKAAPHDYVTPYRRGLCLLRTGDEKGAVESFRLALSIPNPQLMEERFDAIEAVYKESVG